MSKRPQSAKSALGAYLRAERERMGLSQRQLADRIGIHHSYLARLEAGEKESPAAELLQHIAEVLEIDDPSELLAFIGVKPTLPQPRIYFRRAYGLTEEQAVKAAQLIEQEFGLRSNNTESDD